MADPGQHTPDFTVASLGKNHLHLGTPGKPFFYSQGIDLGQAVIEVNSLANLCQGGSGWAPGNLNPVCLGHTIARMGKLVGQFPVIGDQNQSLAHAIQASHGKKPLLGRDDINNTQAPLRIHVRGEHAGRLIEDVVDPGLRLNHHTIDPYFLAARMNSCPQHRDNLSVHLDPALFDQLLATPPASQPTGCKQLLQSHRSGILFSGFPRRSRPGFSCSHGHTSQ